MMSGPALANEVRDYAARKNVTQASVYCAAGLCGVDYAYGLRKRQRVSPETVAKIRAAMPPIPLPRPHALNARKIWCAQCDRLVFPAEGEACEAPFCQGKAA